MTRSNEACLSRMEPPPRGEHLVFFAGPDGHVDGQPSGTVPRRIAVVETDGSRGLGTQPWRES